MTSIVGFFHKIFPKHDRPRRPVYNMSSNVKKFRKNFQPVPRCGKCGSTKNLENYTPTNEKLCKDCINLIKLYSNNY